VVACMRADRDSWQMLILPAEDSVKQSAAISTTRGAMVAMTRAEALHRDQEHGTVFGITTFGKSAPGT
jgi:hypothetical protein